MLARTDAEEFARSLDDTVKWLKEHDIEVVLVDPQYTASLEMIRATSVWSPDASAIRELNFRAWKGEPPHSG